MTTLTTAPAPAASTHTPEHRFIGDPTQGPCVCGKPYASPIHHSRNPLEGQMRDTVMWPTAELPIPRSLLFQYAGATKNPDGSITYGPAPIEPIPMRMTLGGYDLGRWVVDAVSSTSSGRGPVGTVAMVRQIEAMPDQEPIDDDVTDWLKAKRDEYRGREDGYRTVSWAVVDRLLNDYREHRATGQPLTDLEEQ